METVQIDFIAVIIAAIVGVWIRLMWYSSWLFGEKKALSLWTVLVACFSCFLTSFFLGFFESALDVVTVQDGVFVGFCVWVGFVMTTQMLFLKSWGWKQFGVHTSYSLCSLMIMGGIIGA